MLGVAELHRTVLSSYPDPDLRVYMVWVPKLRGLERDVPSATIQFPEPRALNFWDALSVLVNGYRDTLALPEDAWDMFLLYDRRATWDGDRPPKPAYWAHQLGSREKPSLPGPYLDGEVFRAELQRLANVQ